MKKIAIILTLSALTLGVFAQSKPKAPATPKEMPCAVMPSHKVNVKEATKAKMYQDYNGRRYFFCCAACPAAFKSNPKKYAKSKSLPAPKKA
jgi:YHS domain-containing protein